MNGLVGPARELAADLRRQLEGLKSPETLLCPPFTALAAVREAIQGSPLKLGAQDVYWEAKGAFTGEISTAMLVDAGCSHVILGHSERRHILGETDEMVNRKLRAALAAGLVPIVCVGELLAERDKGVTNEVVERQVTLGFKGLTAAETARAVIAYEPVWAIGTGRNATPAQACEVHCHIRCIITKLAGVDVAQEMRILYGGSVKPENTRELMAEKEIDGALVGGASLDATGFAQIVRCRA